MKLKIKRMRLLKSDSPPEVEIYESYSEAPTHPHLTKVLALSSEQLSMLSSDKRVGSVRLVNGFVYLYEGEWGSKMLFPYPSCVCVPGLMPGYYSHSELQWALIDLKAIRLSKGSLGQRVLPSAVPGHNQPSQKNERAREGSFPVRVQRKKKHKPLKVRLYRA